MAKYSFTKPLSRTASAQYDLLNLTFCSVELISYCQYYVNAYACYRQASMLNMSSIPTLQAKDHIICGLHL